MSPRPSRGSVLLFVLGCGLAAAWPAVPAATETLDDGLRRCAQQADSSARLACFDAMVATLPQVEADRFGMTAEVKRQRDPEALERAKSEMLSGKIAALRQGSRGELIFTLDNQQVWRQAEAEDQHRVPSRRERAHRARGDELAVAGWPTSIARSG